MARPMSNNNLRDETGALIGGLVVEDYNAGHRDYQEGLPPPDMTSPSYDLGRQRAAEKAEGEQAILRDLDRNWLERRERLKAILPADAWAEYERENPWKPLAASTTPSPPGS